MKSTKKLAKALLICTSLALLVACDDDVTNYPSDLSEYVLDQSGCDDETQSAITDNQYEDVYDNISDSNSVSAQTLDNILYKLAKENLIDDYEISDADFTEKYQQKMIDVATSGSYSTDNEFDEYRYALSLKSDMYDITTATGSTSLTDIKAAANTIVIDPDEYETVQEEFDAIFSLDYTDYITRYYKPMIYRQYLYAKYIYDQSYSSIGNTNARDVTIVQITDDTDNPGSASKLVNAYVDKYIEDETVLDVDITDLARMWKGVNVSTDEAAWIDSLGVDTLADEIDLDIAEIKDSEYLTDSSLESQYTGGYTYPVEQGRELALSSLQTTDLVTDGIYLKSSGLTSLPSSLKTRIFSTNYSTDIEGVEDGSVKDVSYVTTHGDQTYRFVTPEVSLTGSGANIVNYDSDSGSYYIVQVNSIVTTSRIAQSDSDSDEVKATKRELANEAAYEMASSDSYKKSAIVWLLLNNDIDYSDEDFYDYIDTNYPAVFEDD
jgi:hypothetical protein